MASNVSPIQNFQQLSLRIVFQLVKLARSRSFSASGQKSVVCCQWSVWGIHVQLPLGLDTISSGRHRQEGTGRY